MVNKIKEVITKLASYSIVKMKIGMIVAHQCSIALNITDD